MKLGRPLGQPRHKDQTRVTRDATWDVVLVALGSRSRGQELVLLRHQSARTVERKSEERVLVSRGGLRGCLGLRESLLLLLMLLLLLLLLLVLMNLSDLLLQGCRKRLLAGSGNPARHSVGVRDLLLQRGGEEV